MGNPSPTNARNEGVAVKLPKRKANRLPDYDYSQNGAYFVTICTQDRKRILSDIVGDDAHIVPKPYGLIVEKYIRMIIRLDYGPMWASAPTNTQMDSRIQQKNKISSIVRSIKTLTTKEIGKPIFQRSFYDHVIRNQRDYDEIWQYIENNPLKWLLDNQRCT